MSDFVFRDAQPDDKEEVLALTASTWEDGDYIRWVYDDWVSDPTGRFLVALDPQTRRIAGLDKLSFMSPTEAWFEGLRVHTDYRRRGLATSFQTFMIGEARRMGAEIVRFLTLVDNVSVHRKAYRDGFSALFVARHWKWTAQGDMSRRAFGDTQIGRLREATPNEAPLLYVWWQRSSSWHESQGLVNRNWSFSAVSPEEWIERTGLGELLLLEGTDVTTLALPPPFALVADDTDEDDRPVWVLSHLAAIGRQWGELAQALEHCAHERGIAKISGLMPDNASMGSALRATGFTTEDDQDCLCLFELWL